MSPARCISSPSRRFRRAARLPHGGPERPTIVGRSDLNSIPKGDVDERQTVPRSVSLSDKWLTDDVNGYLAGLTGLSYLTIRHDSWSADWRIGVPGYGRIRYKTINFKKLEDGKEAGGSL